jgi:hypothetical protein
MLYLEFNLYRVTNKKSNRESKIKSLLEMLLHKIQSWLKYVNYLLYW